MLNAVRSWKVRSWTEYQAAMPELGAAFSEFRAREQAIASEGHDRPLRGYSAPAAQMVDFSINWPPSPGAEPNWRETLVCPITHLNNRVRAAAHFMMAYGAEPQSRIYATEQRTHFFDWLTARHPSAVGSDFLDGVEPGAFDEAGHRCEDLTRLTFADGSFDFVLSFDVLEHIPDFEAALRECARVLGDGGKLLLTAPFAIPSESNKIRAVVEPDGTIRHILPPEYHGDPVRPEGVLCYQHFGWQLLDQMRESGFSDAFCHLYWSEHSGYLGGLQVLMVAEK